MATFRDHLTTAFESLRVHKLRAALTVLGLTMGVAALIMVMTLVQGANLYVEQKIANLGTNVFQIARLPFAVVDFSLLIKARRNRTIDMDDLRAVAESCTSCQLTGASAASAARTRWREREVEDTNVYGHTPNMASIDTRTLELGRYFNETEDRHGVAVCLIGDKLRTEFFAGLDPLGRAIRVGPDEFTVIGTFEKIGSVLGQDRDNFVIIPLSTFLRTRGPRSSLTLQIKAAGSRQVFESAQDEARVALRARRHITGAQEEDFFIGTADSYITLWENISSAFFAVFVMVSAISAVVGGIVIMNVMLVSVTERTKEIGIRRAVGATQADIRRLFLVESVMQCLAGGAAGIVLGFGCALALRILTAFPASVETWVALLGVGLSSAIGLFFGIYPAVRASRLDPVEALRAE